MDCETAVSDLLRKALVVANKLQIAEFEKWARQELMGYEKSPVPDYRRVHGEVMAFNPYHGWQPVAFADPSVGNGLSSRAVGQRIRELEGLVGSEKTGNRLTFAFPHKLRNWLSSGLNVDLVPTLVVSSTQILGILDAVRNIITEWSLRLEADGITGEGLTFTEEEKTAAQTKTYNIENFCGVIGDVQSEQVQIGAYNSIHPLLKSRGVAQKDRNELENLLDEYRSGPSNKRESLRKRARAWLERNGRLIGTLTSTIKAWFDMAHG